MVEPERNQKLYAEHEQLDWSFSGVIHRTIYRPFYMLYKEPILVLVTIYLSVVYGVLYAREYLFITRQQTFLTIFQSLKRSR
jgi:MFS transporter, DHA1 family, multidrug resistance protein